MFNSISCKERGKKKKSVFRFKRDCRHYGYISFVKIRKKTQRFEAGFFSYFIDNDSLII